MSLLRVTSTTTQDSQPLVKTREQRLRRQQSDARRGEFERKRQSFEAAADVSDGGSVAFGERKIVFSRLRPGEEKGATESLSSSSASSLVRRGRFSGGTSYTHSA